MSMRAGVGLAQGTPEWSDENPIKTRQSMFLELFPNAKITDGHLNICPITVNIKFENCNPKVSCYECKEEYWLAEVE